MDLVLVDPSLEARSSHHYVYNAALAKEAASRGWSVRIISHKRFPFDQLDGTPVLRHFDTNGYPDLAGNPVRGHYDAFKSGNDALFDELMSLPQTLFPAGSLVLCPTATEFQLYGLVRWAEIFPPASAPQFVFWLMMQSGISVDGSSEAGLKVHDPLRALFYRLAMDRAKTAGGRIALFGSGPTHASEYAALAETIVEPHPVLMSVDADLAPRRAADAAPQLLLYAGDAKLDKGLAFVPELALKMRQEHADWTPVVHANFTTAWGKVTELQKDIEHLPLDDSAIAVKIGMIGAADYTALYANASAAVLSYDPAEYTRKSSGVLWETIAMALPVVVPAGTWLEDEVKRWGGIYEVFESWAPDPIFAAISRLLPRAAEGGRAMQESAARFAATNSAKAALDQLGDVWLRSAWLRSDMVSEADITLGPTLPNARGWYDLEMVNGKAARWLSSEMSAELELPSRLAWLIKISGPKFISPEIIEGMQVYVGDRLVDGSAEIEPDWSGWRYTGSVWTPEPSARTTLRIVLPSSAASGGDGRQLTAMLSEIVLGMPTDVKIKDAPPPSCPVVFDRGQSARAKTGDGKPAYRLGVASAGSTRIPILGDAVLRFDVSDATAAALADLRISANGIPLACQVQPTPAGFAVRAPIDLAAQRQATRRLDIEIVMPALTPTSRLRFSTPSVTVHNPRVELTGQT